MSTRFIARKIGIVFLVLALTLLFTLAGCTGQETSQQAQDNQSDTVETETLDTLVENIDNNEKKASESQPEISAEPKEIKESVTLYFGDQDAMYLIPEKREVVLGNKKPEEA